MKNILFLCLISLVFTTISTASHNSTTTLFGIEPLNCTITTQINLVDMHQIFLIIHIIAMAFLTYREIMLSGMPVVLIANP